MRLSLWTACPQDSLCLVLAAGFSHNDGLREFSVEGAVFCDLTEGSSCHVCPYLLGFSADKPISYSVQDKCMGFEISGDGDHWWPCWRLVTKRL